jgi:hypothetical protein
MISVSTKLNFEPIGIFPSLKDVCLHEPVLLIFPTQCIKIPWRQSPAYVSSGMSDLEVNIFDYSGYKPNNTDIVSRPDALLKCYGFYATTYGLVF